MYRAVNKQKMITINYFDNRFRIQEDFLLVFFINSVKFDIF